MKSNWLQATLIALFALLPLGVFGQADQIVYGDSLQNGWISYGWATLNYSNTSPVHSGADSISVDATNYQALSLHHTAFNTSAYSNLTFWINGGSTGDPLLTMVATINGVAQTVVHLAAPPTNAWQQYTVTWSALGVANSNIDGFWIQEQTPAHRVFYVDDIKLTAMPPPATVHLTANANQIVRTVDTRLFGLNTATWDYALNSSATTSLLSQTGMKALRFPGGSSADAYHWAQNTGGGTSFDGFAHVATNLGAQVFTTVNYGSGTAQEATAWVLYSNVTNHYAFKYWEIGNENYGSWETDTNAAPNDPYTYAVHAKDYINGMKAADPTIKIGVPVVTGEDNYHTYTNHTATNSQTHLAHNGWTPVLLTTLKNLGVMPDFLIYHRYAQNPGEEDDAALLQSSATWTDDAADLRQQVSDYLGTNGTNIELLCTENNSVSFDPGKQSTSLVNALFMADSLGQIMQTEFNSLFWWDLRNGQESTNNNNAALYGGRQYGDYGMLYNSTNCYPTYYASKLMKYFARGGDKIFSANSDYLLLSMYAAKRTNGSVSLLVINKSSTSVLNSTITLAGFVPATNATSYSYGIPQDNAAQSGVGSQDIAQTNLVVNGTNFALSFPAYSLTVISLPPAPPQLTALAAATNGHFQFKLAAQSGSTYAIQTTTNLTTWTSIATNSLMNTNLISIDLLNNNAARQFYRAVWLP